MFVNLVKKNKFIILFLSLFFNCFFINTVGAVNLATPTEYEVPTSAGDNSIRYPRGITFNNDGRKCLFLD